LNSLFKKDVQMKKNISLAFMVLLLGYGLLIQTPTVSAAEKSAGEAVQITDKGAYYDVVLDFGTGLSHKQIGEALGEKIQKKVPEYEALIDLYLLEITQGKPEVYQEFIRRANVIKAQVDPEYRDEIEGMASKFSGGTVNAGGDKKLSKDEMFLLNLIPDAARGSMCSTLAVFGARSETKKTMVERTLDWPDGSQHQAARIQAVTTIKNGKKSVCLIGYLGFVGAITGFNSEGIFAGILDSSTGAPYAAEGKRSYPMDIRWALENKTTLDAVADVLKDPAKKYTYNHLIVFADKDTAKVLENNMNGIRALRSDSSELNKGGTWEFPNAIGAVNAFMLKGNPENFHPYDTARWPSMKKELKAKGDVVTYKELKEVASFCPAGQGPGPQTRGDLYNSMTQQIVLFQPQDLSLEIFFCPKDGKLPSVPTFLPVTVKF
jgi:hypothetical protein